MTKNNKKSANKPVSAHIDSWLPDALQNWQAQALLLALLSIMLYINTTGNLFALDDGMVILENRYTQQGFKGIWKLLTTDSLAGLLGDNASVLAGGRYRPLSLITFAMEYQFFGGGETLAKISHAINTLLYACCVVLLLGFLRKHVFSTKPDIAFLAAFLFAIHPIHTEAVANLKGRDELMCFLFMFLALHRAMDAIKNTDKSTTYLLQGGVAFLLALLSKENAITFIAIIPLTIYFFTKASRTQLIRVSGVFWGVFVMYFIIRVSVIGLSFSGRATDVLNDPYILATPLQALATKIYVLSKYLALLLIPYPLSFDYSYNQLGYFLFDNWRVWASVALHAGLIALGFIGLKSKNLVSYSAWYYLFSISIVSNFVIGIGAFMGERFLFQASVAFALVFAYVLYHGLDKIAINMRKYAFIALFAGLTLLEGGWIIKRNKIWRDNETLFLNDVNIVPNSCKAQKGAGEVLIKRLDQNNESDPRIRTMVINRAIKYYHEALRIHPKFIDALLDMGASHYRLAQYDSTEIYWLRAQKLDANHPILKSHWNLFSNRMAELGGDEYARKNYPSALELAQKSLKYNPTNAGAYYVLGNTYGLMENYSQAIASFKKATEIEPNNADYWYNLGGVAYNGKNYPVAIEALTQTLRLKPDYPRAQDGLNAAKALMK